MGSAQILERLRRALTPDYVIDRELASGGMGSVFLARDVMLDRAVAIKVMKPELATARAVDAFLREARVLAGLRHPNVVGVFRAGQADGLPYYVMEFMDGETLAQRLARGPLAPGEALKLGRDLLDGLEAAHTAGIVHRDIKPANIFLLGTRALLGDFGIARTPEQSEAVRTTEGRAIGTPGYQPPEQAAGAEVTERTDVYAAGVVLYESFTGRRWPYDDGADWSGVPRAVARVLRRALAWAPAQRWPDAASFRKALWRTRTRRYVWRTMLLAASALAVGVAGALWLPGRTPAAAESVALSVQVAPFTVTGAVPEAHLGDSLTALMRGEMSGYPDFTVVPATAAVRGPALLISGRVWTEGAMLHARIEGRHAAGAGLSLVADARVPLAAWPTLADSLTYPVLIKIWDTESPLAASLPLKALPRTTRGLAAFLTAERLIAAAQWGEAYQAYSDAEAIDTTCWLCSWRLHEVERWLARESDPAREQRYRAHVDAFPPAYQSLIHAASLPLGPRLDTLHAAAERWDDFFLESFQEGDELFHRGPLAGHRRAEAIGPLEHASRLRDDFAPTWEHLTWVRIAEGDSTGAVQSLTSLARTGTPHDPFAAQIRSLLGVAFAWRFLPPGVADADTRRELTPAAIATYPDLAAGPRLLLTFDAPRGAVQLGGVFARMRGRPDLERSGWIARITGNLALGRPAQATADARVLEARLSEPELTVFAAELSGMLLLVDSAGPAPAAALGDLRALAARGTGTDALRRRAAWMLALVSPGTATAGLADEPPPRPLSGWLEAEVAARAGQWSRALEIADKIDVDSAARDADPFIRALARLSRASWLERMGNVAAARRELRWHEHTDVIGALAGSPQAAEIDWAFGTLARWRLARLLDGRHEAGAELCASYGAVVRLWAEGEPQFRARARTARERYAALKCEGAS